MRKLIIAIFIASSLFTACTNVETENLSAITYFPVFTISGANPYFVEQGTTYVEPGAVAKAGATIVPTITTAVGKYRGTTTLDTSKIDEYEVTYSATNVDGFVGKGSRKVIIYKTGNLVNSIEGVYTSTILRNGVNGGDSYIDIKYIYIWKKADGTYQISDSFGGWYEFGRAIAHSESPGGIINAVDIPTNNFTFPGTHSNAYFGGTVKITGLTVNPTTKQLVMTTTWVTGDTTYNFLATLTQVQL
ncbi:hypothetical protein FFWV33_07440 [Flavobacterium faecale]|uniref:Pesticidal crystal protein Cry22Aa Ig-like domain-containing protein n=1 Tax=Flavobacterium faecale TaxID=1355330 RepID=A0A2S1LC85_9FLAO|nr:immunoglobulin-like domain-containing protein [Flavobacterium faecale]AWG21370.1 hypothetical protein FFWV33_07440 [Flavobacterium faecale]